MANIQITEEIYNETVQKYNEKRAQYDIVASNLAKAKAEGDTSDSAGHDLAVRERVALSAEIHRLVDIIDNSVIVTPSEDTSICGLYMYITLLDSVSKDKLYLQLVDDGQGRPQFEDDEVLRVSVRSQLGSEIIGRAVGQTVIFLNGYSKRMEYTVTSIKRTHNAN